MKKIRSIPSAVALLLLACSLHAAKPYDVLDLPAVQSPLAAHALIYSLTRAGDRFFATGIRGHILYSDDFGQSWTQAESVPVRSSLLDASFPTPDQDKRIKKEKKIKKKKKKKDNRKKILVEK